jgi:hypothetical protein
MTVAVPINPGDREDRHSQEGRGSQLHLVPSEVGPDATTFPMSSSDQADFERLLPDRRVRDGLLRSFAYGVRLEPEAARRNENR